MSNEQATQLVVYGIKNCDSCRNVQRWLKSKNVPFVFHDIRTDGLPRDELESWLESPQGPRLVNRRSTTWRKLTDAEKQSADSNPLPLLMANPTLIKRPVITDGTSVLDIGFSPDHLETLV